MEGEKPAHLMGGSDGTGNKCLQFQPQTDLHQQISGLGGGMKHAGQIKNYSKNLGRFGKVCKSFSLKTPQMSFIE